MGVAPPGGLFDFEFTDTATLQQVLREVDPRWRLDVVHALEDLNDERADDGK